MKVNFNKSFKNYKGEDVLVDTEVIKEGKKVIEQRPQMISDMVCRCLFSGETIERIGDAEKDNANKLKAHSLCMRIIAAKGAVELTTEEATLIKQAVSGLNAGGYAQIVNLIEGGK
ncbi:alkylhydroperoxidase [Parabacteroides provencensis]|uniref:alkylhydroperoxidase n=1 Tax=Parabacteroides provencensis TaxID=1944636 RepID=UPI000C15BDEA|nr:alkylhydroperoxidase [Parabacteroides provencensis]